MEAGANDENCTLKSSFQCVLEKFVTRISNKIELEYLIAAVLDPHQVFASYTSHYLDFHNLTIKEALRQAVNKYELNSNFTPPTQSQNSNENVVSLIYFYAYKMNHLLLLFFSLKKNEFD